MALLMKLKKINEKYAKRLRNIQTMSVDLQDGAFLSNSIALFGISMAKPIAAILFIALKSRKTQQ